jgi:hypothetical protein
MDTKEPFYVGKGKDQRAYKTTGRSKFWHNVVNKHGFEVIIVKENLTEEESFLLEQKLVNEYGRKDLGTGILVNLTNGGEGVAGKIYSSAEREFISNTMKSYYETPENREKRKVIAKEVNARPEVREKIRTRAIEQNSCEEFKKMKSHNTANSWKNIDIRKKRVESIKKTRSSEESKNKTKLRSQKTYKGFISPTGKIYSPVVNLADFCTEHNLSKSGMYGVNSRKLPHHKGWVLYESEN